MSDEAHMESAASRHRDLTRREQWHGQSPDAEVMMLEEGVETSPFENLIEVQRAWLIFIFSAGAKNWKAVAARIHASACEIDPAEFCRRSFSEIEGAPITSSGIPLSHLVALVRPARDDFRRLLRVYLPAGKTWLRFATMKAYLLARQFQPDLLRDIDAVDYEALAGVFGEIESAPPGYTNENWQPDGMTAEEWRTARDRARSRWSARAQDLLARPISEATGRPTPALFGEKSATVRAKYRSAAIGNQNRLGTSKPKVNPEKLAVA